MMTVSHEFIILELDILMDFIANNTNLISVRLFFLNVSCLFIHPDKPNSKLALSQFNAH